MEIVLAESLGFCMGVKRVVDMAYRALDKANGLPVVTTAACGYAGHVETAQAGIVVAEPFRQDDFLSALAKAQDSLAQRQWSAAGAAYGAQDHLYSGWSRAADLIIGDLLPATKIP